MEQNELMIGDWIVCNGLKLRVASITDKVNIGFRDADGEIYWAEKGLDRIDYIPLTEEILVKNGWDFRDIQYGIKCEDDKEGILELSRDEDGYYWSINRDEYMIIRIHYVHQLQQLIRLCGITKELEL